MPVAVKDIVAHVSSMETPARSIDAYTRSVADAVGALQTKADVAALHRDLVANIGPMNAAIAHDPRVGGAVAPVGVAQPAAAAPIVVHPVAPGARRDDDTGPPAGWTAPDVPATFAEIKAEIAALASKVDDLAATVSANMPLVTTGPDGLPPVAPETPPANTAPNGPVDPGS